MKLHLLTPTTWSQHKMTMLDVEAIDRATRQVHNASELFAARVGPLALNMKSNIDIMEAYVWRAVHENLVLEWDLSFCSL